MARSPDHPIARWQDRPLAVCIALFLLSQLLFLPRIAWPPGFAFDEVFYVPAARGFLYWTHNLNRVHPPLGKYLIALGMALWGDNLLGWRFAASIFGGLTVAGLYAWARAVFHQHRLALWAALVALTNQMLYVQARTGMLDVFLFGFMVWGLAAFSAAWSEAVEPRRARRLLLAAGLMFGLATACKWMGVVPWAVTLALAMVAPALRVRPPRFTGGQEPWVSPETLRGVGPAWIALALVAVPLAAYWATFLPLLGMPPPDGSLAGLWDHQLAIWQEHTSALGPPIQATHWYQWAFNVHPMQFWFAREGGDHGRAVLLVGNPLVLGTGFVAALGCLGAWLKRGSRAAFLVSVGYWPLYLSWAVIPRRITYFYYYYPAAMVLTLALIVVPLAAYWATFLPLLAMPPPDGSFAGLWDHQLAIWQEHTTALGPPIQATHWYEWTFNRHAMQFWFAREGLEHGRAVLLVGNPLVLWTGFVAALGCLGAWLKRGSRAAFLVSVGYWPLYLSWAVIPRRITYFYYYYPAAMALTLALAFFVDRWQGRCVFGIQARWAFFTAAALVMALLYPLSSAMRVPLGWVTALGN